MIQDDKRFKGKGKEIKETQISLSILPNDLQYV
jgi:hypothetical protein